MVSKNTPAADPAATTAPVVPTTPPVVPAPVAAPKAKKSEPITVKYRDHKGDTAERTFSKDVHGEDFADLADQFKKTNADKIVSE